MVGDQRGHLARGHEPPDVSGLGLGKGAVAAIVLGVVAERGRAARRRPGPAPEAAVVAVGVRAELREANVRASGLHAVALLGIVALGIVHPAVLAVILVGEDEVGPLVRPATAVVHGAGRLARGVEALGVDDRHHDRAHIAHQPADTSVVGLVAVDQLVGPLDGVLGRRPLAGVVGAHLQKHRLAVAALCVGGDLDSLDAVAGERLERQGDRLDDARIVGRQLLHLVVVVGEPAIAARAAAGQGRGGGGLAEAAVGSPVAGAAGGEVGDARDEGVLVPPQLAGVGVAVQHHLDEARATVLGEVEPERRQLPLARRGGRRDLDKRDGLRGALGHSLGLHGEPGALGRAGAAAGLHDQLLVPGREALGDLVGSPEGRAGHSLSRGRLEDGEVPVAGVGRQPCGDQAGHGRPHRLLRHPGGARERPLDAAP